MGTKDAGYFGKGVYFTQYPHYSDVYVRAKVSKKDRGALSRKSSKRGSSTSVTSLLSLSRNITHSGGGAKSRAEVDTTRAYPLILSWVLLGDAYPVTELPTDPQSLLGKGCEPGYDSHYACVKEVGLMNFFPCRMDEPEGPDYDEIVIFNRA
jgi:hypothetical protein